MIYLSQQQYSITDDDLLQCSRYINRNLADLCGGLEISNDDLRDIQKHFTGIKSHAYFVLKKWFEKNPEATKHTLQAKLQILGFTNAAKRYYDKLMIYHTAWNFRGRKFCNLYFICQNFILQHFNQECGSSFDEIYFISINLLHNLKFFIPLVWEPLNKMKQKEVAFLCEINVTDLYITEQKKSNKLFNLFIYAVFNNPYQFKVGSPLMKGGRVWEEPHMQVVYGSRNCCFGHITPKLLSLML